MASRSGLQLHLQTVRAHAGLCWAGAGQAVPTFMGGTTLCCSCARRSEPGRDGCGDQALFFFFFFKV